MSFLDKLSANVTNAGRIGSQKFKNMSEANTLKSEQSVERRRIQEAMNEIAKLYFEKYKDDPTAEFADQITAIKTAERHIAELQAQIEEVRAREPELIPVPEDAPKPQKTPTAMVCMQCGRSYPAGEYACKNCGSQLVPQYGSFPNASRPTAEQPAQPVQPAQDTQPVQPTQPTQPTQPVQEEKPADTAPVQPEVPVAEKSDLATNTVLDQTVSRFCAYCGKPTEAGQSFCTNCGKKL